MARSDDRWKDVALLLEASDVGVDLEAVTDDPEWSAQAIEKHGARSRDAVAVFDFLIAAHESERRVDA